MPDLPSAADIRRIVLEPWCPTCCGPHNESVSRHIHQRPPLWQRAPDTRPEGLEWRKATSPWPHEPTWRVQSDDGRWHTTSLGTAHALICWGIVEAMAKAIKKLYPVKRPHRWAHLLIEAMFADEPLLVLASAHHKYLDAREASDA